MKNWLRRAVRTTLQSAVGYLAVAVPNVDWSADKAVLKTTLIGIGISAVSAGLSAVMNLDESSFSERSFAMPEELRKEICREFFSGHTVAEIAESQQISPEEIGKAVAWGAQSGYLEELEKRSC